MREIKFRVWHIDNDPPFMTEWDEMCVLDDNGVMPGDLYFALSGKFTDEKKFMQYTGLKDKNGKEIYEGDIVNVENQGSKPYIVEYVPCLSSFRLSEKGVEHTQTCEDHMLWSHGLHSSLSVVVIGNIYENPKLSTRRNA